MSKILVVDDEAMMRMLANRILAPHYEVVMAESGAEAIELYAKESPDMVLSDVLMPEMSGYELLETLRGIYHEYIPVMFMTADDSEEGESRGFETGANDYIRKPFKPDVLLKRIENILRQIEREESLRREATTDPMTRLLNKATAQAEMAEACARERGALLMIDLDSFKLVNDLHGHEMGDKVLIAFADLLRSAMRQGDRIGRIGGDEFLVFCVNVQSEHVIAEKSKYLNERIIAEAKRLMGPEMNIPLGVSLGAVIVPDEGTEFEAVFSKADKALYQVKQNGKHGYEVYRGARSESRQSAEAESWIRGARMILQERNGRPGAMEVGFENFQSIYRFLLRSIENYHKDVAFLILKIEPKSWSEAPDFDGAVGRLREVFLSTLRKSDVVTMQGRNQIFALLPEADGESGRVAVSRCLARWKTKEVQDSEKYDILLEIEDIDA